MPPSSAAGAAVGPRSNRPLLWAVIIFGALLAFIFRNSFVPELTLFSNDGPLGAISADSGKLPTGFFGVWNDLNWVGTRGIGAAPNISSVLAWAAKPVLFSKVYPPVALFLVGLCAWFLFRQMQLAPAVCILGGLAAILNSSVFSIACWGLPAWSLARAMIFLALGILASQRVRPLWMKAALAGLAVGMAVMEGFDVGAIYSLYVAAFVLFLTVSAREGTPGQRLGRGVATVAVVAFFAAFIAAQSLSALISTQVQGVIGTQQDTRTKEERWDWATQWSLPKIETLRVIVPGLFGYRMDTPEGGEYWGGVGRQPGWEQHHQGYPRHSGSGEYAGVLVLLLAGWSVSQAFRGDKGPYDWRQRQFIWFWAGAALISLLLAFGRHAPFYGIIYQLPYFSTIRNPIKFMNPFHVAAAILFAYGLQDLYVRFLSRAEAANASLKAQWATWWRTAPAPDKVRARGLMIALGCGVAGLLIYSASRGELERFIATVGFDEGQAKMIAGYSIRELLWTVVFLAAGVALILGILSGWFAGPRRTAAGVLLGLVLVLDLARADLPWIVYYNYQTKYASNPVIDVLRDTPHEHRTASRLSPLSANYLVSGQAQRLFSAVTEDWLQQQYQFYQVQSLDIVQMPRMPEMDATYLAEIFAPVFSSADFLKPDALLARLTNRTDAVSQFLWTQFTEPSKAALAQASTPAAAVAILQSEFNRVMRGPSIYDPARFNGVKLSEEARGMAGQAMAARDVSRLNRLLLEDAYPSELARRTPLVGFARLWQLTNTRLILGMKAFLDVMNQQMDPANHSFQVKSPFDFAPRESAATSGGTRVEDITTVLRPEGQFAVFEYGAALPRAKLYTQWQVTTNDFAVLEKLADPAFDPHQLVFVANGVSAPSGGVQSTGAVRITRYEPKRIALEAKADAPSVLLLNDKYDPSWNVTVDGKEAPLLRCNYIMRGVALPAGNHQVEFRFTPPHGTLYVSLAAIGVGLVLCGMVIFGQRESSAGSEPARPDAAEAITRKTNG